MRIFEDDDAGYLAWVENHQHGFDVNSYRKPDPRYLILHRATCGTITGKPARDDRWMTGEFIKACSETRRPRSVGAPGRRWRAEIVRSQSPRLTAQSARAIPIRPAHRL
jgi:hypothetical protein